MDLADDPILGRFFDSPEKKARWLVRIRLLYILWIAFVIFGILFLFFWYFFLN